MNLGRCSSQTERHGLPGPALWPESTQGDPAVSSERPNFSRSFNEAQFISDFIDGCAFSILVTESSPNTSSQSLSPMFSSNAFIVLHLDL